MQSSYKNQTAGRLGRLFYVIGPSGVGKDTLMEYARERLSQAPVIFAHRYITRPVELKGENHIHLSEAEFTNRLQRGCFKFNWQSHGWMYALGTEVDTWLNQGLNVVMNGSRGYFEQACSIHPDLIPVMITAPPETLRQRLVQRGRESVDEIEERIARASEFVLPATGSMRIIENETTIEEAGEQLVSLFLENLA
ncbi:phosphonate metabolism protein/1,5-bisphosphokinase (PRPP-forming) PhnN [Thiomicrorhabdus sp.]|uniref:phosphonate metabolism protein/1,5-bisphosphokinase (PRPP-forming) PhnN n=1 Tax=Thiomicrorhabdus sp. TaxID=2039724 RepID=UPI0035655A10